MIARDRADRQVGWLVALCAIIFITGRFSNGVAQIDLFAAWWSAGAWIAAGAFIAMAVAAEVAAVLASGTATRIVISILGSQPDRIGSSLTMPGRSIRASSRWLRRMTG